MQTAGIGASALLSHLIQIDEFTCGLFSWPGLRSQHTAVLPKIDNNKRYTSPPREWKEFMRLAKDLSNKFYPLNGLTAQRK
jgi:hypothetical protein